jgi:hypothetical protein
MSAKKTGLRTKSPMSSLAVNDPSALDDLVGKVWGPDAADWGSWSEHEEKLRLAKEASPSSKAQRWGRGQTLGNKPSDLSCGETSVDPDLEVSS